MKKVLSMLGMIITCCSLFGCDNLEEMTNNQIEIAEQVIYVVDQYLDAGAGVTEADEYFEVIDEIYNLEELPEEYKDNKNAPVANPKDEVDYDLICGRIAVVHGEMVLMDLYDDALERVEEESKLIEARNELASYIGIDER